MEEWKRLLRQKEEELQALKRFCEDHLKDAPPGRLRITHHGKQVKYYQVTEQGSHYLGDIPNALIRNLAQKSYYEKLLHDAEIDLANLRRAVKIQTHDLTQAFTLLHEERQNLITPAILTDEQFIARWYEKHPGEKNPHPIKNGFTTDNGEEVRSKTEKIQADSLKKYGIPYVYECPITIKGLGLVYVDFTALNVRERKTYYMEHLGMMEDPDYCRQALNKIDMYNKNGFVMGENMLYTFESSRHSFDQESFENLIRTHLL